MQGSGLGEGGSGASDEAPASSGGVLQERNKRREPEKGEVATSLTELHWQPHAFMSHFAWKEEELKCTSSFSRFYTKDISGEYLHSEIREMWKPNYKSASGRGESNLQLESAYTL